MYLELGALLVSILAVIVSGVSVAVTLAGRPDKTARSQLRNLELDVDELYERVKTLHARKAVSARRAKEAEEADNVDPFKQRPDETADAWKARVRELMRNGAKPGGGR